MKTKKWIRWFWMMVVMGLVLPLGAMAQEEEELEEELPPVEEPTVPVVPPAEEPEPPEVVEPVKPPKAPPTLRGADMRAAFKGTASSKFGMGGRVNKIPRRATKRKSEGWRRNIELGVNTQQGNRDTLRYQVSASATKETDLFFYYLKGSGKYGESDREKDTENATGEAKVQRRLTERTYASLAGNVFHDQIADLSYRAVASLSLGRHFIRTDRTALSVEAGPGYVAEDKGGEREGFVAARLAQYFEFLVTPTLQVWQALEYLPNLEETEVYFVNVEAGLETLLMSNLSLKFTVENRYDSNPARNRESNELLTSTALVWSF